MEASGFHRAGVVKVYGRLEGCDTARNQEPLRPRGYSPGRFRGMGLGIFCTYRLNFHRGCDRTLRPFRSGGRSLPGCSSSILPGPTILRPVTCPLHARAIDIFGLRLQAQQLRILPFSALFGRRSRTRMLRNCWLTGLVHEAAHTNIHDHPQRQEHEQHGRPAITHQRQGYSCDGHKAYNHADVD